MRFLRTALSWIWRCHWFTWCVTLVVGAAMVLIVVPGVDFEGPVTESQARQSGGCIQPYLFAFEHGWPRPFLVRSLGSYPSSDGEKVREYVPSVPLITFESDTISNCFGATYNAVSWSNYDNWPFVSDASTWHLGHLLLDTVIALTIIGVIGACTEWWLRSRGGLFRFRIIDLLAATGICGLLLGWYQWHVRLQQQEVEVEEYFFNTSEVFDRRFYSQQRYFGPNWLQRLVGHTDVVPFCQHIYLADFTLDEERPEDQDQISKLPYLEDVSFYPGLTRGHFEQLAMLPRLRKLRLSDPEYQPLQTQEEILRNPSAALIRAPDFGELVVLKLKELEVHGGNVLAEDVEVVASLPTLEKLELSNVSVTLEELDAIRQRHPRLTIMANWSTSNSSPSKKTLPGHVERVEQAKLRRQKDKHLGRVGANPLAEGIGHETRD